MSTDGGASLPAGFPVGRLHRGVPDRRRGQGRTDEVCPSGIGTFAHTPGRVLNGDTGDVACDHYHRWPEDLALLGDLGVNAYRFSIAWPRVQPDGSGPANAAGLDFYDRLVDALIERGIAAVPHAVPLFNQQTLEDAGGWLSRDTSHRFAEYAVAVAERLGDRVSRWITLNEPIVHMTQGYAFGTHAPGRALIVRRPAGGTPPTARSRPGGTGTARTRCDRGDVDPPTTARPWCRPATAGRRGGS